MKARLDKWVAQRSGLSRKVATQAIRRGRVTVHGEVVRDPRTQVDGQGLALDGEPLEVPPEVVLYHKPVGVVCTTDDPWGRDSLASELPEILALGLHPVGRLDAETDGLLLFSRDGGLTQRLLHPRHGVPKTYRAVVEGQPGDALVAALAEGVQTAEGVHTAAVQSIEGSVVVLTVTEGKHRMVRRMLHNAGHSVLELRRLAFGACVLGDLAEGQWREPNEAEWAWLQGLRG